MAAKPLLNCCSAISDAVSSHERVLKESLQGRNESNADDKLARLFALFQQSTIAYLPMYAYLAMPMMWYYMVPLGHTKSNMLMRCEA